MLVGISCLVVFLIMALLMYGRRISALLALPIMAIILALVGGVPGKDILDEILAKGAVKLNVTYTTTMFGAMLAELLNRLGIAKALIRWVAEFAGDNPFVLSLLMTFATAILFSTLGGPWCCNHGWHNHIANNAFYRSWRNHSWRFVFIRHQFGRYVQYCWLAALYGRAQYSSRQYHFFRGAFRWHS